MPLEILNKTNIEMLGFWVAIVMRISWVATLFVGGKPTNNLDQIELELGPRVSGRGCVACGEEKVALKKSLQTDDGRRKGIRGSLRGPR